MGGKSKAPAAPDYSQLAQSSTDAAKIQAQTSADQLAWAKQQYAQEAPHTAAFMQSAMDSMAQDRDIAKQQLGLAQKSSDFYGQQVALANQVSQEQLTNARKAQQYYETTFQPIESQFAQEAQGWNTPQRAAERSAQAQADVASTFAGQRQAALQSLEGYGIDPSQTRYGALDLGTRISQAAAQAAAGTTSRNQTEATGLALQGEAINIGRGYPGQVAGAYSQATGSGAGAIGAGSAASGAYNAASQANAMGIQAGGQGINAGLNTSSIYGNMMGSPTQWSGLQNASLANAGNLLSTGFQNQLAGFNANTAIQQNQISGISNLIGSGVGIAAGALAI